MTAQQKILIAGLGNVLMGDDAAGPCTIAVLKARYDFSNGVIVEDLGTPGLDLTPYVSGYDAIVLVDSVFADGAPGELRRYTKEQILESPPPVRVSPHDPGIKEALFLADLNGEGAETVVLIGIIPESSTMQTTVSARVERGIGAAADAVVRELSLLGIRPSPTSPPRTPDFWWRKRPGTVEEQQNAGSN